MATPTNLPAAEVAGTSLPAAWLNDIRGAFRILQVFSTQTTTAVTSTSPTFSDTGLSITITPQSTTSKILLVSSVGLYTDATLTGGSLRYLRNSLDVLTASVSLGYNSGTGAVTNHSLIYMDSPASVSAQTYKVQVNRNVGSGNVIAQVNSNPSVFYAFEVSA